MSAFTAIKRLADRLEVKRDEDTSVLSHITHDTRSLPPSRRTYGPWSFVGLWMVTSSINVGGWTTDSSIISLGPNVWQSMLAIIVAHCCAGIM